MPKGIYQRPNEEPLTPEEEAENDRELARLFDGDLLKKHHSPEYRRGYLSGYRRGRYARKKQRKEATQ